MKHNIYEAHVKDVMSKDVVAVRPDDTVQEVLNLMVENRLSALPVIDRREHCVGMISMSDLTDLTRDLNESLEYFERSDTTARSGLVDKLLNAMGHERVDSVMTETVVTVKPENLVVKAAQEMLRNQVHRLPVVDKDKRLLGILSTTDILNALVHGVKGH